MKRILLAGALSLLLLSGTAMAGPGGVTGFVKLAPHLGLTSMGTANGGSGFGVPLNGGAAKVNRDTKLHLISMDIDMARLTPTEIENWYKKGETPAGRPVFITTLKEDGSYEFTDVPAGRYYLVIVAGQMDRVGNNNVARTKLGEALSNYLPEWDQFAIFNIGLNSAIVQEVTVSDGALTRLDHDFGLAPFSGK